MEDLCLIYVFHLLTEVRFIPFMCIDSKFHIFSSRRVQYLESSELDVRQDSELCGKCLEDLSEELKSSCTHVSWFHNKHYNLNTKIYIPHA